MTYSVSATEDGSFRLFLNTDEEGNGVAINVRRAGDGHQFGVKAVGSVALKDLGVHHGLVEYYVRMAPRLSWSQVFGFGFALGVPIAFLAYAAFF